MNKINKIARKIVARSQIVLSCSIDEENNFHGTIQQAIYLQPFSYNYAGLKSDIVDFAYDVNRELQNIGFSDCIENDIVFSIGDNGLFIMRYNIDTNITEQQKELIMQNEWRIKGI